MKKIQKIILWKQKIKLAYKIAVVFFLHSKGISSEDNIARNYHGFRNIVSSFVEDFFTSSGRTLFTRCPEQEYNFPLQRPFV